MELRAPGVADNRPHPLPAVALSYHTVAACVLDNRVVEVPCDRTQVPGQGHHRALLSAGAYDRTDRPSMGRRVHPVSGHHQAFPVAASRTVGLPWAS